MSRDMKRFLLMPVALLFFGCGESDPVKDPGSASDNAGQSQKIEPSTLPENSNATPESLEVVDSSEAGARTLLKKFLVPGADHAKLSALLAPRPGDYAAAFIGDAAAKAATGYQQAWKDGKMVISPKAGQTELLLWNATSEELNEGTGDAGQFPGGYQEAAKDLKPGVTWYRFKFVEPGKTLGMAFDGLACINGRWTIFPKPWRVLR